MFASILSDKGEKWLVKENVCGQFSVCRGYDRTAWLGTTTRQRRGDAAFGLEEASASRRWDKRAQTIGEKQKHEG